jgi:hypothetical protein
MTTELRLSQVQSDRTPAVIGLTTLFLAILALSFAAIFIKLSERELGKSLRHSESPRFVD